MRTEWTGVCYNIGEKALPQKRKRVPVSRNSLPVKFEGMQFGYRT